MSLLDTALENAKIIYSLRQENEVGYSGTHSGGFKTLSYLDDTSMSLEDKRANLINTLKCLKTNENRLWTKKKILTETNSIMLSYSYWTNKNGWRAMKNLTDRLSMYDYLDDDMIELIDILFDKTFEQDSSYFTVFQEKFNKILKTLESVQAPKYQGDDGVWTTYYNNWQRFCYHSHPNNWDKVLSQKNKKNKESLKGFEYEGAFASSKDFRECMQEMHDTDFLGGKLYDERNYFMPTEDSSLHGPFTVEFWLCPMSSWFAKKFFKVFLAILKKHNWQSSSEINNSGIHCHLDANLFNQKTLKKFIDTVYDMDDEEKLELYQRDGRDDDAYNNWDKDSCYDESNHFVQTDVKNSEGQNYYLSKKIITANVRRTLLNLEHLRYRDYDNQNNIDYEKPSGTLELRGFNSKVNILNIIDKIDGIISIALQ